MALKPRSPLITVMSNAARKAAKSLLRDFQEVENLQVSVKSPSDFVSQADLKAEAILKQELAKARPNFAFLMEESGASGAPDGKADWEFRWVVDPLDGTTNFLHAIPHWAISIAAEKRTKTRDGKEGSEIIAGIVYSPAPDEMFWAEKGSGAYLNEGRMRVSARRDMGSAVFATGIPFASVPRKAEFSAILNDLMPQVAGIRRFGAAALDLAWVSAGRFDGFWELGLQPWDIAAGLLMVREAGGFVTAPDGSDAYAACNVVAGNEHLHEKLRGIVHARAGKL
jgi:myo-inositol-1(or 4)-monophosphatase